MVKDGYIMQATGGTITYSGNDKIHTFLLADTGTAFTPIVDGTIKILVVAGGGGGGSGGSNGEGGGGGGQVTYNATFAVTAKAYTVTVGDGGAANVNGNNSVFDTITSIGGKHGLMGNPTVTGGASGSGNAGGKSAYGEDTTNMGGGGGQGAVGEDSPGTRGGNGGIGASYDISGTATYYAGGGGGGSESAGENGGAGGNGGGGAGGKGGANGTAGTAATGGGGGGAGSNWTSGKGGSGIVIIRYAAVVDSGIRMGAEVIGCDTLNSTHKLRFCKNGTILGLPLVDTTDTHASKVRIYSGSAVKSLVKVI